MFLNQILKSIQLCRIQFKRMNQKLPWRSFCALHPLRPVDPKEQYGSSIGHQKCYHQPSKEFVFNCIAHLAKGLIDCFDGLVVIGGETLDGIVAFLFIVVLCILKKQESIQYQQNGERWNGQ